MNHEISSWALLSLIPRLGPRTLKRLLSAYPNATQILELPECALTALGVHPQAITALKKCRNSDQHPFIEQLQAIENWAIQPGNTLLSLSCSGYPPLLREIADPPLLLYVQGDPEVLRLPQIAVVGSRNASISGRENARCFARELSLSGWIPTSGLALGIDSEAHQGALQGFGLTIAAMATGIDRIYPHRNRSLAEKIVAEGGALVTESPLGTPPRAELFPKRNRIISGLSLATLVVEASPRSGSLITAMQALQQGREVFAMPGSIHNPLSKGCHELIRQGAKLVDNLDHIYEELGSQLAYFQSTTEPISPVIADLPDQKTEKTPERQGQLFAVQPEIQRTTQDVEVPGEELRAEQKSLLQMIGYEPTSLDQLVQRTELTTEQITSGLLELELLGCVHSVSGGYQRR